MLKIAILSGFLVCGSMAMADRSTGEAVDAKTNDAKRAIKKGGNRVKEAVCSEGDVKCLGKKAKHRTEEGVDYTKDKAKELKDQVD